MRRLLLTGTLATYLALTSGCALWPKPIELFQKKVKPVPELSESGHEHQRQAADYLSRSLQTNDVANALSQSLGPPSSESDNPERITKRLRGDLADLNSDLRDYAEDVDKVAGKKIEGTGLIKVGYFTGIGIVLGLIFLLYSALRIYGIFNPVVGGIVGTVGRVSASVLHNGFTELVAGGEQFKTWIQNSHLTDDVKDFVIKNFNVAQQTQQSAATQKVVDNITDTTIVSPTSPIVPPSK